MIIFDISSSHPCLHQDSRVRWQRRPVPWSKGKSGRNLFASVEHIRKNFAGVEHRISLGAVSEEKALEENDLNEGGDDESDVNENVCRDEPAGAGDGEDECCEDDP